MLTESNGFLKVASISVLIISMPYMTDRVRTNYVFELLDAEQATIVTASQDTTLRLWEVLS